MPPKTETKKTEVKKTDAKKVDAKAVKKVDAKKTAPKKDLKGVKKTDKKPVQQQKKKEKVPVNQSKQTNPLFEARPRKFHIGGDIKTHKQDLTRFVRWPTYVRLQKQKKILQNRLKVPPSIHQFSKVLDKNTASELFKLLHKHRPEELKAKKDRLKKMAAAKAEGKTLDLKAPLSVVHGVDHITKLVEQKKASLVVIANDVDPIELVVWLPALCRKMDVPYCIVKGKARLGTVCHVKQTAAIAFTKVADEAKADFNKLVEVVKANYNERYEEARKEWGGGSFGAKTLAARAKAEKALKAEQSKLSKF